MATECSVYELPKLIVSALTPLLILVLTLVVNSRTKRLERSWSEADRIAEKRVELYDEIGIKANRIYCYIYFVGNWKETSPPEILSLKREMDATMYTYRPWFSAAFFHCYEEFKNAAFAEYKEKGENAKIRTDLGNRPSKYPKNKTWDPDWEKMFDTYIPGKISKAYDDLRSGIAVELGLNHVK